MNERTRALPETLGGGLLPAYWQRWEDYDFEESFQPRDEAESLLTRFPVNVGGIPPGVPVIRRQGDRIPYTLTEPVLSDFLSFVVKLGPDRDVPDFTSVTTRQAVRAGVEKAAAGRLSKAEMTTLAAQHAQTLAAQTLPDLAGLFMTGFGPLFPNPLSLFNTERDSLSGKPHDYSVPPVERPGAVVSVAAVATHLRMLNLGLLAMLAVRGEGRASGSAAQQFLDAVTRTAPSDFRDFYRQILTLMAENDSHKGTGASGERGALQAWLRTVALGQAVRLQTTGPAHHLAPAASAPGQVAWLAIAHESGAITLPGPRSDSPLIRFCRNCNLPVYSQIPRKSGDNVFCDPPKGPRSVCANQYWSAMGKIKAKARPLWRAGIPNEDIAAKVSTRRFPISAIHVAEWAASWTDQPKEEGHV